MADVSMNMAVGSDADGDERLHGSSDEEVVPKPPKQSKAASPISDDQSTADMLRMILDNGRRQEQKLDEALDRQEKKFEDLTTEVTKCSAASHEA
eukprot:12913741-Heterocapsa_arctica.AAC.1